MTLDEQWAKTKRSIMRYLREGWSINVALKRVGLKPGQDLYQMYSTDMEFRAERKPYMDKQTRSVYEGLLK